MKTLYFNGQIYTGEGITTAFIVEDDKFVKVGESSKLKKLAYDKEVDLKGDFVTAGLNDSHLHVTGLGGSLQQALLSDCKSIKEIQNTVRAYISKNQISKGEWVRGRGWNHDYFQDEVRFLTKEDLDQISVDHPICLERTCGHICVANSKALEILNINEQTPSVEGGEIQKNSQGQLTGIFKEKATSMIMDNFPKPDLNQIKKILVDGCRMINSYGITSVQSDDFATIDAPIEEVLKAYKELIKEDALTLRVYEQAHLTSPEILKDFLSKGYTTGVGDNMFKIGPLKMFGDGSLGARSALLRTPYSDDNSTCGIAVYSQEQLDEMIGIAHEGDMQVAIHAIGDKCMDMVINSVEKALKTKPKQNHRHGIIHCQIADKPLLERYKELNLLAYVQTIFLDYDINIVRERVGKRADTSYAFKTLMDMGVNVSNGSDSPVEYPDAMAGIQCAVTRQNLSATAMPYLPNQAMTVEEALKSFTINGAYASFEEEIKGKIKENYLADFTIWDQNIFETNKYKIKDIKAKETYLGGNLVYKR